MHREENRREIGADDLVELLWRCLAKRRRAADAGIGEDDVELADLSDGFRKRLLRGGGIGDIDLQRQHAGAERLFGSRERFRVTAGDHHLGTLVDEDPGGRKTDAAVSAGNQGDLVS